MKIITSNFGELEIPEENIITFHKGIPGFIEYTKYVIINEDEEDSPFCWLQSIEDPELAFAMINPFRLDSGYSPKFPDMEIEKLGGQGKSEDYSILAIMTIPDNVEKISANLMAPVVINIKTKNAAQIITEGNKYPIKHYLYKELKTNKDK